MADPARGHEARAVKARIVFREKRGQSGRYLLQFDAAGVIGRDAVKGIGYGDVMASAKGRRYQPSP